MTQYNYVTDDKKLAIVEGEPISRVAEIPNTSAEALKYAVEQNSGNELVFIQKNGGSIVLIYNQYIQIWECAERILGGLRAFGLRPGYPLIFQIDTKQDFVPALWSCIMGGFIPVPVPLASDYTNPDQAFSSLYKIWQELDYPTILTTSTLASQVHFGLQLYGRKKVAMAIINEIQAHSPDNKLQQLQANELALLLPSSGTTGKLKLIEVDNRTFIYRFLKNAIDYNNNSQERFFLSWAPIESISGIFTTMPNGFRKNIYLPLELLISNPLLWLDILSKHRVTHAQTSNFILAHVLDQLKTTLPSDWDFSSVQRIGIGAETIVAKTLRSFIERLSIYNLHSNVLHPAYGMTECGPIASSTEGFSLGNSSDDNHFVEIGKPETGHSIRIVDQQGCILEEGQIGRIQVIGPSMTSGYYKAPELTRELFTEDGWINTGDLGFLQDGKLTITGREKEIVIINARNYSCQEIELVVVEVEGVEPAYTVACAIRPQDSDTDELAIFFHTLITEDSQLAKLAKQIRGKVTQTLGINPTYIIPIEKTAIPRTATGKIQRLQLKQSLEVGEFDTIIKRVDAFIKQESEKIFVSPRDELELQLTKIWETVLGIQRISVKDNFFTLGGHSLLAVRLLAKIEEIFTKNLPLSALFQAPTVEQLAKILRQEKWSSSWYSLVPIVPHGNKPPLFAIHTLGEGFIFYRSLARHLEPGQPIWGLRYGLAAATKDQKIDIKPQQVIQGTNKLAAHYIEEIKIIQPQGPYFLAAISGACNIALEMARQLHAQGERVALLSLIDGFAPGYLPQPYLPKFLRVALWWTQKIAIRLGNIFLLDSRERVPYLQARAKNFIEWTKTGKYKNKDWMRHLIQEKSNPKYQKKQKIESLKKQIFDPQAIYAGKITLFRSSQQPPGYYLDPMNGWGELAAEEIEVHEIYGDHYSILLEPNVRGLAQKIKISLDKAQEDRLNSTF